MIQTDGEVRTVNKGHVGLRKYMLEGKTLLRDYEQDNYFFWILKLKSFQKNMK